MRVSAAVTQVAADDRGRLAPEDLDSLLCAMGCRDGDVVVITTLEHYAEQQYMLRAAAAALRAVPMPSEN